MLPPPPPCFPAQSNLYFCWEEKGLGKFSIRLHILLPNEANRKLQERPADEDLLTDRFPKISFFVSLRFLANFPGTALVSQRASKLALETCLKPILCQPLACGEGQNKL